MYFDTLDYCLFVKYSLKCMVQPLIVACNKVDVTTLEELEKSSPEKRALVAQLERDGVPVMQMSTLTQQGVMEIKKEVSGAGWHRWGMWCARWVFMKGSK